MPNNSSRTVLEQAAQAAQQDNGARLSRRPSSSSLSSHNMLDHSTSSSVGSSKNYQEAAARIIARRNNRNQTELGSEHVGMESSYRSEDDRYLHGTTAAAAPRGNSRRPEEEVVFQQEQPQQGEAYSSRRPNSGGSSRRVRQLSNQSLSSMKDNDTLTTVSPRTQTTGSRSNNAAAPGGLLVAAGDYDGDEGSDSSSEHPNAGPTSKVLFETTEEKLREAERIIASEVFYKNKIPDNLIKYTLIAFLFQMFQSMFLVLVASKIDARWYWYTTYPDPDLEKPGDNIAMEAGLNRMASVSVLWFLPIVTIFSGLEHFSTIYFRSTYMYFVERHQNPFRWIDYTITAGIVKVLIAMQAGVTNIHILVCLYFLMAICVQQGANHETVNAKARSENRPQNWRSFITSCVAWFFSWAIIWNYFIIYTSRGGEGGVVWLIMILLFIADGSFAFVFRMQWARIGSFEDYIVGEKTFIMLSITTKTMLMWLSVLNAARRT